MVAFLRGYKTTQEMSHPTLFAGGGERLPKFGQFVENRSEDGKLRSQYEELNNKNLISTFHLLCATHSTFLFLLATFLWRGIYVRVVLSLEFFQGEWGSETEMSSEQNARKLFFLKSPTVLTSLFNRSLPLTFCLTQSSLKNRERTNSLFRCMIESY